MLTLPASPYTVDAFALLAGTLELPDRWLFEDGDSDMQKFRQHSPDFCFLVVHKSGRKLLFDLGMRKDLENSPKVIRDDYPVMCPTVAEDVSDILERGPHPAETITDIVLSHLHFDHIGDCTRFPWAALTAGPGSRAATSPGYPLEPLSPFSADVLNHRGFRELTFDKDIWCSIGPFHRTYDYFGDGSFYLVDTPGHMPGHLGALAQTSEGEWLFMGGDCCHHRALLLGTRPVSVSVGPNGTTSFHKDVPTAIKTISVVRQLEKYDNVLVALAHDAYLVNKMPLYPKSLAGWKGSRWKRELEEALKGQNTSLTRRECHARNGLCA